MELTAKKVPVLDGGNHRDPILGHSTNLVWICVLCGEGMDKIYIAALIYPFKQRGSIRKCQAVPADMGQFFFRGDPGSDSFYDTQTWAGSDLLSPVQQQLHSKADPQHRLFTALFYHRLIQACGP